VYLSMKTCDAEQEINDEIIGKTSSHHPVGDLVVADVDAIGAHPLPDLSTERQRHKKNGPRTYPKKPVSFKILF